MLIAVKSSISSLDICLANHDLEFICISVCTPLNKVIISVCYRPPNCTLTYHIHLLSVVVDIKGCFSRADMLLFGNFNFPLISWHNLSSESSTTSAQFLDVGLTFNLTQLVNRPTRQVTSFI